MTGDNAPMSFLIAVKRYMEAGDNGMPCKTAELAAFNKNCTQADRDRFREELLALGYNVLPFPSMAGLSV